MPFFFSIPFLRMEKVFALLLTTTFSTHRIGIVKMLAQTFKWTPPLLPPPGVYIPYIVVYYHENIHGLLSRPYLLTISPSQIW